LVITGPVPVNVNWSATVTGLVPAVVVTRTSTVPAECAGLSAVIEFELLTTKLVAGVPPKVTPVTLTKLPPVIVTLVPPPTGPAFGFTLVMKGVPSVYVNWLFTVLADVPSGVVTRTDTVPGAACPGLIAEIVVEFTTVNGAAADPNVTAVAPLKPVPVIVTVVPPARGPEFGLTELTTGPVPVPV
jgi:hypothetical protein